MVMRFPAKKRQLPEKHRAISRQEKMAFSTPRRVALGSPPPSPRVCTSGTRTLTSEPKFLGFIGYQICLPMVLHELRYYFVKNGLNKRVCV